MSNKFFKFKEEPAQQVNGPIDDKELMRLIEAEMRGNIMILIDPKQKDSFSQARVNTWTNTTAERVLYYVKQWIQNNETH